VTKAEPTTVADQARMKKGIRRDGRAFLRMREAGISKMM
jgi:hypothetical protein